MITLKKFRDFGAKHGSTLCTLGAIVGIGVTIIETWRSRPVIEKILDEQREKKLSIETDKEMNEEDKKKARKNTTIETGKRIARASLPVGIAAGATAGFTIAARVVDSRTIADMATYISIKEAACKRLEDKTKEVVGVDQTTKIKTEIAEDTIEEKWIDAQYAGLDFDSTYVEQAYGGDVIFFDWMTGASFRSDKKTIQDACDRMNTKLSTGSETYFTYNEFRSEIGLRSAGGCDYFGWGVDSPSAQRLVPNMNNTAPLGDGSAVILDWWCRPDSHFK